MKILPLPGKIHDFLFMQLLTYFASSSVLFLHFFDYVQLAGTIFQVSPFMASSFTKSTFDRVIRSKNAVINNPLSLFSFVSSKNGFSLHSSFLQVFLAVDTFHLRKRICLPFFWSNRYSHHLAYHVYFSGFRSSR